MLYEVSYTAYEPNNSFVLAEGKMQFDTQQAWQAENIVKNMFPGSQVLIHSCRQAG